MVSSGKTSESHPFVYTPVNGAVPSGKLLFNHVNIFPITINLMMLFCFDYYLFYINFAFHLFSRHEASILSLRFTCFQSFGKFLI